MASEKKRRKDARQTRKQARNPLVPFRHRDGDRRRRGSINVDQVIADKRAVHDFEAQMLLPPAQEEIGP